MITSKKIIIIGSAYPLRSGGIASFNERLANEFMIQGFDTTIYSFSLQYPKFLFPGKTQYSTDPPPLNLKIITCINSVNPFNWIKIGNKIKNIAPDIIVVRYWLPFMAPCLGTILRRIKKNKYTKIICIADNIVPHEKRPGDNIFTKYFIKPVDAFITMSRKVLSDLHVLAVDKPVKYVPHPLYDNFGEKITKAEARKKLNIAAEDKIILFFGFIRKYKGLDILLESMKLLKDQNQNIRLLIAGEFYDDKKIYDAIINNLQIKNMLILHTEFIRDSEIKNYLCAADCVVQPYRSATQSGVTPLAYHFEKPMIVTNVGGLPDMVSDYKAGLIAQPNAADIAKKIIEFFQLGEDYFLPHLREEKKKYTWKNMVHAIVTLADKPEKI